MKWTPHHTIPSAWMLTVGYGIVGYVKKEDDGLSFSWKITAANCRRICKEQGAVKTKHGAMLALERNWRRWLNHFQLESS